MELLKPSWKSNDKQKAIAAVKLIPDLSKLTQVAREAAFMENPSNIKMIENK